jgi:hypothetical protein
MSDRPANYELERDCIASFFVQPQWLAPDDFGRRFYDIDLQPSDFYDKRCALIFSAMLQIAKRKIPSIFPPFDEQVRDELARLGLLKNAGGWEFIHGIWRSLMVSDTTRDPTVLAPGVKTLSLSRKKLDQAEALAREALEQAQPWREQPR